jgi:hypothetical protein
MDVLAQAMKLLTPGAMGVEPNRHASNLAVHRKPENTVLCGISIPRNR